MPTQAFRQRGRFGIGFPRYIYRDDGKIGVVWILAIHHKSGAAYGATHDAYFKNPKNFDSLMEKWGKTPTIKMASFAVTFVVDDF